MFGPTPVTLASLIEDFQQLGVSSGETLLLHSSLRSLGSWVCGGATTVVAALLEVLGPEGTLVVPAQSPETKDPSRWSHISVPEQWWPTIREQMAPFDPALTPATTVGVIAERVRTWPGAVRSAHPLTSFAAIGAGAERLLEGHELSSLLGEASPLARLEAAGSRILLLGVGYDRCTAFHLAEYRLPDPPIRTASCLVATDRGREWVDFDTVDLDSAEFELIGKELEASVGWVRTGRVAAAESRLLPLRESVQFAYESLLRQRSRRTRPRADATAAPGRR
ncbi:AAC(3) family N-acetyltransferase [Micromonospora sp. NPDC049679]|uniref:aminoglycoside N(3)-acetyltransferase n=1 Tax=Micromonospora sp. NPDC049679 TaxID=3155920 RepID=UPI0033E2AAF8